MVCKPPQLIQLIFEVENPEDYWLLVLCNPTGLRAHVPRILFQPLIVYTIGTEGATNRGFQEERDWMARIGIMLTTSPFQFENWETAVNIADAAQDKGHEVALFLSIDGVYWPASHQSSAGSHSLLHERFLTLLGRGARVLVCGTAAEIRGFHPGDYAESVLVGGLPDFAMLIGELDRLVSL